MPNPTAPATVTLMLAGAPRVRCDGVAIDLALPDALLLAWLALEGPTARERLAALLWPNSHLEAARNALRQRLFRLRRQAGADLVSGSTLLALAEGITHDLGAAHDPGAAAAPLLAALCMPDCPELDAWLTARRSAGQARARQGIEARIEALETAGDSATALPLALALLEAQPLSEDAHRRVMRLHYLRGDRAAAMLAFDRCEQVLKHEVGTTPSPSTLALLRTVESQHDSPPAPGAAWGSALPAAVLRPPRMVGRDAELAALQAGWRAGSVLLVSGEAGMGKSRLLQALAHSAGTTQPGAAVGAGGVAFASARPGDHLVPYASIARLLRAALELAPRALSALPMATQERLAPLLPGLAPEPATPPRRALLLEPVLALLLRARSACESLVLDDLHFADDASLELLQALLTTHAPGAPRGDQPLRWCLGLRPPTPGSALQATVQALESAAPLLRVPVQPLTAAELAELVDSLALPGLHGAAVAAALRQRSGGNPLFALETLKLAWSHGGLDFSAATPGEARELPRPQSLTQLIGQQLARLSAPALTLARVAAVAGVGFSLPLAAHVLGQSALQLADPWHELEQQQVMVGTDFAHDLVFEAVLARVPAVINRHLHGQIAAWLESQAGAPAASPTPAAQEPARIAAHWEAAGERARALPWLRAAAAHAHHALRERERINFLLRAADIAEATGARAEAFECVAQAIETHMNSIRQADGFPLLDRLDSLADAPAERARALGQRAWYCAQLPDHAQATRVGAQALALAEPLGDPALSGPIRHRLATSLAMLGRFDESLVHLQALQAWADEQLAPDALPEFHGNFAVVLDNLGRPEQARDHHRRALAHSRALGDHAQHATHLANHAVNRLNAGEATAALALAAQGLQLSASFELQGASTAFLWLVRSNAARALGQYRDALEACDEAERFLRVSNPLRLPAVWLQRAHCWLDLGQHARAGQALQSAATGAAEGAFLPPHLDARRLWLHARWQRALGQDAQGSLQAAAAAAPANGWPEVRMAIELERASSLPSAEALPVFDAVRRSAESASLRGTVLAAWLLRAGAAPAALKNRRAARDTHSARAARTALDLAAELQPTWRPRAEVWLCAARGLAAAGLAEEAAATAAEGQRWLRDTALQQVDESFRESFLQRCATHAELLAWSA